MMGIDPEPVGPGGAVEYRLSNVVSGLASVIVSPRKTVRRLLDAPNERVALVLILLATLSQWMLDDDFGRLVTTIRESPPPLAAFVAFVSVGSAALLTAALFFLFSFLASWTGRWLGGTAGPRGTRIALAWGAAPLVWSLLWAVPARIFFSLLAPQNALRDAILGDHEPGQFLATRTVMVIVAGLVVALIEIVALTWTVVTTSQCLGEAHGFSAWRGLASYLIAVLMPLMLLAGCALTFVAITSIW